MFLTGHYRTQLKGSWRVHLDGSSLGSDSFVKWVHPFMQRFLNDELKGLLPLLFVHDNHGTHGRRQGTHSEYLSSCWVGSHNVRKTWSLWILSVPSLALTLLRHSSFHPCIPARHHAAKGQSSHLISEPLLTYTGQGFLPLIPEVSK